MKLILTILLFTSIIYANENFEKNIEYICFNTLTMKHGERYRVDKEESINKAFIFSLKEDKLITTKNEIFNFKVEKSQMVSYSNEDNMLLLLQNMELGLVPKKEKGQIQYYFKCKVNNKL